MMWNGQHGKAALSVLNQIDPNRAICECLILSFQRCSNIVKAIVILKVTRYWFVIFTV